MNKRQRPPAAWYEWRERDELGRIPIGHPLLAQHPRSGQGEELRNIYDDSGFPLPRSEWPEEPRSGYEQFEILLAKTFCSRPTRRKGFLRDYDEDEAVVYSGPATRLDRLKLALQTRWPRVFGWLVIRWRHVERVP